ncbi:MAG: hypothetical protein ACSLFQ_06685 [Thermoanaerobaculia bacterium]
MIRNLPMFVLVLCVTSAVIAQGLESSPFNAVTGNIKRAEQGYCGSQKVIAAAPRPAEMAMVVDWIRKNRSDAIATEVAQSFASENASPHNLAPSDGLPLRLVDAKFTEEGRPDWEALHLALPGIKCVVALSAPGVDSTGTFGIVRYDLHLDNGLGATWMFDIVRAANGKWEVHQLRSGMYLTPKEELRVFGGGAK